MKYFSFIVLFLCAFGSQALAENTRLIQQQLDQSCETARLEKLTPLRKKYAATCVAEWDRSQDYCERFYSDYGNKGGAQAILFYDLPACEKAWKYRQRYRATE